MLNKNQLDTFRFAITLIRERANQGENEVKRKDSLTNDNIVYTPGTLENFFGKYGRALTLRSTKPAIPRELCTTVYGDVYRWKNAQSRAGERPGTLYVMDFGERRAAYFELNI